MRAATISVDPNKHRNLTDILIVPEMKGIELRDWKDYEPAIEAGYNDMKAALADVKGPLAQIIRGNAAAIED
jgi:NTE family protein